MNEKQTELAHLLDAMDVPPVRRADFGWLSRNLAIRNAEHPHFERAMKLIGELRKSA